MAKKLKTDWMAWSDTVLGLLSKRGLPQDLYRLKSLFDGGYTPLDAYEYVARQQRMRETETVAYSDGTTATGPGPLPGLSPKQQTLHD